MARQLSANGAEMQSACELAKEVAEQLSQEAQQLAAELSEFLSSGWQGQASDKFRAAIEEWHDGAKKVHAWLTSLGERVGESAKQYLATDTTNEQTLKSADIGAAGG